jgi:hypothetical protein
MVPAQEIPLEPPKKWQLIKLLNILMSKALIQLLVRVSFNICQPLSAASLVTLMMQHCSLLLGTVPLSTYLRLVFEFERIKNMIVRCEHPRVVRVSSPGLSNVTTSTPARPRPSNQVELQLTSRSVILFITSTPLSSLSTLEFNVNGRSN